MAAWSVAAPRYEEATTLEIIQQHVKGDPTTHAGGWQVLPDLPTPAEILQGQDEMPDLPTNPVDRPWSSKEAYLTAQYQILRREGTEGLRYSTSSYRADTAMSDDRHTCVYTDIHVKGYLMTRIGPVCRIDFSTRRAGRKIKWQQSRRLTPGTVVAISTAKDNFRSVCKIATIAQRPFAGGLDQNPPEIDITWANVSDAVFDPEEELVMIESRSGYFEAVRHALVGLQHASSTDSPIDKYIVNRDQADRPAAYVAKSPDLNLDCLMDHLPDSVDTTRPEFNAVSEVIRIKDDWHNRDILEGIPAAIRDISSLDASQVEALHRIVSKELAIIQGPPGTGKTFTSVSALKVLLANRRRGDPPVVVSAQTNHALDQLLLHCQEAGANILRVGGRTDNELIAKRTSFELRKQGGFRSDRTFAHLESQRQAKIEQLATLVKGIFSEEQLLSPQALLEAGIISQAQYNSLLDDEWEATTEQSDNGLGPFDSWLGDQRVPAGAGVNAVRLIDFEEEEVENEIGLDYEVDPDLDNLIDDNDEDDRLKGTWIPIRHVWTGKNPRATAWRKKAEAILDKVSDLYDVPQAFRGGVYQVLQAKFLATVSHSFKNVLQDVVKICQGLRVNKWSKDVRLVENHRIDMVGCTTTGLTKYRGFLSALQPRTLLIEEAAETREANIASALYPSVQQLILVGDHQQLTPSCDIHWLGEAPFHLNVSMFERLVNLGVPYTMLNQQRRMRPELRFILNSFYPALIDHPHVEKEENRPLVPGMGGRSCWLFDHAWPEDTDADCSKFNLLEADMIVKFVGYLMHNGIRLDQITILTFYNGQRKTLLKMLRKDATTSGAASQFHVHTVDSYQGEENDIILLSLVRSPKEGERPAVGFLEDKNRAVVAISRARRGFYLFGNISNALAAHEVSYQLWGRVFNGFASQQAVRRARGFPVVCQNHGTETWFREPEQFVGNAGGCSVKCKGKLPCGHACRLLCHPMPHESLCCMEPCTRVLNCGHKCSNLCGDKCFCTCDRFQPPPATKSEVLGMPSANLKGTARASPGAQAAAVATGKGRVTVGNTQASFGVTSPSSRTKISAGQSHMALAASQLGQQDFPAATLRQAAGRNQENVEKWRQFTNEVDKHDDELRRARIANSHSEPLISFEGMAGVDNSQHASPEHKIRETFKQTGLVQGKRITVAPPALPVLASGSVQTVPNNAGRPAQVSLPASRQAGSMNTGSTAATPHLNLGLSKASSLRSPALSATLQGTPSPTKGARQTSAQGFTVTSRPLAGMGMGIGMDMDGGALGGQTASQRQDTQPVEHVAQMGSPGNRRHGARGQTEPGPGARSVSHGFETEVLPGSESRRQQSHTDQQGSVSTHNRGNRGNRGSKNDVEETLIDF